MTAIEVLELEIRTDAATLERKRHALDLLKAEPAIKTERTLALLPGGKKVKRELSEAGRLAISKAGKARWRRYRAQKKAAGR